MCAVIQLYHFLTVKDATYMNRTKNKFCPDIASLMEELVRDKGREQIMFSN